MSALWLFLTVPWAGLQRVIVVFPGHTYLRFLGIQGKQYFFSYLHSEQLNIGTL